MIKRIVLRLVIVVVLLVGLFLGTLTVLEYRPDEIESLAISNNTSTLVPLDETLTFMAFNIGYGGLGATEDFVMDGGEKGRPDSRAVVENFLSGITDLMDTYPSDFYLLQEVDLKARRSYHIDQVDYMHAHVGKDDFSSVFAHNFHAVFVPFPLSFSDHIGYVESGMQTLSSFQTLNAERYQFPGAFSWPLRVANLKRAMVVSVYPVMGTEQELVVINLHMSAYDDGSLREQEMGLLKAIMDREVAKGNYVIVGGDFNQIFPSASDTFPIIEATKEFFEPSVMNADYFGSRFSFQNDSLIPTSRLLNQPYDPSDIANTQYYIIDGFIVSDNIEVLDVYAVDANFEHSDHNPVMLEVRLISGD